MKYNITFKLLQNTKQFLNKTTMNEAYCMEHTYGGTPYIFICVRSYNNYCVRETCKCGINAVTRLNFDDRQSAFSIDVVVVL